MSVYEPSGKSCMSAETGFVVGFDETVLPTPSADVYCPDVDVDGLSVTLPVKRGFSVVLEMLNSAGLALAEVRGIALDELVAEVRCVLVLPTDGAKGNVDGKVMLVSDSR